MATWKCPACNWKNAGKWIPCANCGLGYEATSEEIETKKRAIESAQLQTQTARIDGSKVTSSSLTFSGCIAVVLMAAGIFLLVANLWDTLFGYYPAPTEMWLASFALIGLGILIGRSSQPSRKCPRCAETVKLEAKVCRFCGYSFEIEDLSTPSS